MESLPQDSKTFSTADGAQSLFTRPPNIYLVGAQCTGKTTLLGALRTHFADTRNRNFHGRHAEKPGIVEEVVRKVMRDKGFNVNDIGKPGRGLELQQHHLQAQSDAEEALRGQWFISDRSGVDMIVYAKAYLGDAAAKTLADSRKWDVLRQRMRDGVVIVCEAGNTDWLSGDTVRISYESPDKWVILNEEFYHVLREQAIAYFVLSKETTDLQQRVAFVEKALMARL
jgi:nicotinamide riboside kinase